MSIHYICASGTDNKGLKGAGIGGKEESLPAHDIEGTDTEGARG